MILSHDELINAVDNRIIHPVPYEHVNAASIDVTLGDTLLVESAKGGTVDIAERVGPGLDHVSLGDDGYYLHPGEWCLAQTQEVFNLPNYLAAEFRLKSSGARCGLDQALAVWCDPGWTGSVLTLEIKNVLKHHRIKLTRGMHIGQIVFHRVKPVSQHQSYAARGRYNGDMAAQGVKL